MQQRRAFEWLTRLGFAARGLLYIVTGLLVISAGRAEDASGVFSYLGTGAGKWLLYAMSAGFAGYGVWRLADAALGIESAGDDKEGFKRAAAAISGAIHLYLADKALDAADGAANLAGGGGQQQAQTVLQLPGGQLLLGLIALGLAAAAVFQIKTAWRCSFLEHLSDWARESWVKWLGRAGYTARGLVFLIGAYFAARAALADKSSLVGGVEQILEWLSSPIDLILAAGLLLFGAYGLIEAWQRRFHTLDLNEAKRRAVDQIT